MHQQTFLVSILPPIKSKYAVLLLQEAKNQAEKSLGKEISVTVQCLKN